MMELNRGGSLVLGLVVLTSVISVTLACNAKNNGLGWGEPNALIIPKPTLIPKLAAAFEDGKHSVKPVKYGKLIVHGGKGWGKGSSHAYIDGLGHGYGNGYEYGYKVDAPYTHDFKNVYEKGTKHGAKGHYLVKEPNSFKTMNYDTSGLGLGGHGGYDSGTFGDYAAGFFKK